MSRARRSPIDNYDRIGSRPSSNRSRTRSRTPIHHRNISPAHNGQLYGPSNTNRSRSPRRREHNSNTESHCRRRSRSDGRRHDGNPRSTRPEYGGPQEPLILDSNIQISVNSTRSTSPVRQASSPTRIVTVRPRDEGRSRRCVSNTSDRRFDRDYPRSERGRDRSSSNHGHVSPKRRRDYEKYSRESRNRNGREIRKNERGDRRERSSSRDRRTVRDDSRRERSHLRETREPRMQSSRRRSGYEGRSDRDRNSSRDRRFSRDSRRESDGHSISPRRESDDESENSHHEDEAENLENEDDTVEYQENGNGIPTPYLCFPGNRFAGPLHPILPRFRFPVRPPLPPPPLYGVPPPYLPHCPYPPFPVFRPRPPIRPNPAICYAPRYFMQ